MRYSLKALCSLFAISVGVSVARGDFVFVPQSGGNDASALPFLIPPSYKPSVRYQQVYGASDFLLRTNTPLLITELSFAWGAGGGGLPDRTLTNLQINLSSTPRMPDLLSHIFSENIGPDDRVVYSGRYRLTNANCCGPFLLQIGLQQPFIYDARIGNLLLDVRNFQTAEGPPFPPGQPLLLTATNYNDTVSSVAAFDVMALEAEPIFDPSEGLVTRFTVTPLPSLMVSLQSGNLLIRWPKQFDRYVLQESGTLSPGALWQAAGGTISTNGAYKEVSLPLDSQVPGRFYRLELPPSLAAQSNVSAITLSRSKD